jgi:hypothetical protein
LPWQRPFRFQAFRDDLIMGDLTFDEGRAFVWEGLRKDVAVLLDRANVAARLKEDVSRLQTPQLDAATSDQLVWPWVLWLEGRIRHGAYWYARCAIHDLLNGRVIPLLVDAPYHAERQLDRRDIKALAAAAPRSSEPVELRRALQESIDLYDIALDRWAARTGNERPRHPLAPAIVQRIASATSK